MKIWRRHDTVTASCKSKIFLHQKILQLLLVNYIYIYLVVLIVNSYYLPLFLFENRKLGGSPGMWKDGEKTHQKLIEQWTGIIKNH